MAEEIWTIKSMMEWCEGYLLRHGDANPRLSAQWLLSGATGMERIQLYANYDRPLSAEEKAYMRDAVKRRGGNEPLQYIVGSTTFRFIPVKVRPGVLIPRPETEMLAGEVIDWIRAENPRLGRASAMIPLGGASLGVDLGFENVEAPEGYDDAPSPVVVEIGSGSGCISCSVAYEVPGVRVVATDISEVACQVTRENVEALDLGERVSVLRCDMGCDIDQGLMGAVDCVVSNPPYIPTAVCETLESQVRDYEPMLALDGGPDGLDLARRLFEFGSRALRPGGLIAVELFEGHMDQAAQLALDAGFRDVSVIKDLADRPRILKAFKPAV